ncbi:MAG: hypothetical protein OXT65_10110 [Alphaproteobacteria bacterium]|nr:hypothetical protein [Alphaproteobacteria bacterium]
MRYLQAFFAVFAVALLCAASPAFAAIDDAGAARLKADIEKATQWHTEIATAAGQGMRFDGPVTVTPVDDHYEVRLEDIVMLTGTGLSVRMKAVIVNARTAENEKWMLSAALPSSIGVFDAAGEAIGAVRIGKQALSALWSGESDLVEKYDLSYEDISFAPAGKTPLSFSIKKIASVMNMELAGGDMWNGPVTFGIEGVSLSLPDKTNVIDAALGSFHSRIVYAGLPMRGMKDARARALEIVRAGEGDLNHEALRKALKEVFERDAYIPADVTAEYNVRDINLRSTNTKKDGAAGNAIGLRVGSVTANSSMTGLKSAKAKVLTHVDATDIRPEGAPDILQGLLPHTLRWEVNLHDLPAEDIGDLFMTAVEQVLAQREGQAPDLVAKQALKEKLRTLPQLLHESGARVEMKDTHMKARDFEMRGTMDIKVDAASPLWLSGTADLNLHGLDEFMIRSKRETQNSAQIQNYAGMVLPVQMAGQLDRDENGRSIRRYTFEFTAEGGVLLNGTDLSLMTEALMPRPSK